MTDLLITDAMIVTMDADRRVIEKGGLAALLETPEGFWRAAKYPPRD